MALSGAFNSGLINSYWRLRIEWSATQNEANNTSTVTANLFWMADRSGVGRVTASSPGSVSINIDGQSSPAATATPTLAAGGKKLIRSWSRTISHNSNGDKSFTLSGNFVIEATLAGSYVGSRSLSQSGIQLNRIPRASSLSGNANLTAGQDRTVTINRASSNFRHNVRIYVQTTGGSWTEIKELVFNSNQTSLSTGFTFAQKQLIFQVLNGRATAPIRFYIDTWNGNTFIGGQVFDGTVTAPLASFLWLPSSFNIGGSFYADARFYSSEFNHTIHLRIGSTILKTYTGVGAGVTVTTNDTATLNALYANMPNENRRDVNVQIITFFGNQQVRSATSEIITSVVVNSDPTFTATPIYRDTNSATTAITGNNLHIISKRSTVTVELTNAMRALAVNGASMVQYVATLGGKTVIRPWASTGAVLFDFGTLNPSTNQTLVIRAVDSRGNSTMVTRNVIMIPYDPPTLSASARRINGFEEETVMLISGQLSRLTVSGTDRNNIVQTRFRVREATGTAWGPWTNFIVTGFPNYSAASWNLLLDILKGYAIEIQVTDRLSTTTVTRNVASGKPLLMIDYLLGSIGMGEFPTQPNQFLLSYQINFAAGRFGAGNYAVDFNKGNLFGANALFFNDETTGSEGLNFPRQGVPDNSRVFADYHNLRVWRGFLRLDGKTVGIADNRILWSGVAYPSTGENNAVVPSIPLSDCPNGWLLLWSEYVVGGAATDAGYHATCVPKEMATSDVPGNAMRIPVASVNYTTVWKYIYIFNDRITANSVSSTGDNRLVVLRRVIPY